MPFIRPVVVGLALAAGAVGCARDPGDATAEASEEIIGGFPASSAKLNAIGELGIADGNGSFTPLCGGTLISSTMVLTAKHCVSAVDPTQLAFLIGPNARSPIRVIPVRGIAVEPTITGGVIGFGSDLGVVHLAVPVVDVTPLPVAALTDARLGSRMVAVGYGVQNRDLTFGTRQSGSMTLKATSGSVYAAIFGSFASFLNNGAARLFPDLDPGDPAELALLQQAFDDTRLIDGIEAWAGGAAGDAQACTGDGGGPLTSRLGGQTTVFAVSSWGFGANAACTLDGSAYASINAVALDFIDYETQCPLIPRAGTCDGLTVAVRCAAPNEGGRRPLRTDCGELGQICGVDDAGALGCVDDPCEGLPPEGVCRGETATRCSATDEGARHVVATDCAAQGQTCGFDGDGVACLSEPPTCAHDRCEIGEDLDPACDPCVAEICLVDPVCCVFEWDNTCVSEVETVCGQSCSDASAPGARTARPRS